MFADTPTPPYYSVTFTSLRTVVDDGYAQTAALMEKLVHQQDGFLGMESVRGADGLGITVSYWRDLEAISAWKAQIDHQKAQRFGRDRWYQHYQIRIAKVEREYCFESQN